MKIKITQIILVIYLILVCIITQNIHLISWVLLVAAFTVFLANKAFSPVENLIYILVALTPFPYILSLFMFYLPFAVFGNLLEKKGFIKSYILGFAMSLIPTLLIYTAANYLGMPLNFLIIAIFFYLPVIVAISISTSKKKALNLNVDLKDFIITLAILLATVFVAVNIVTNDSLFISNGTYYFSKFNLIGKSIDSYGKFPVYDPSISAGESPFSFETPIMFSHLGFTSAVLYFIPPVAFYNAYSLFILFISSLSLSLLIRSLLQPSDDGKMLNTVIVIIGSAMAGLHFFFVQFLESFKAFVSFPIDYLIFALILEKPKKINEVVVIGYLIALTFVMHVTKSIGIILLSASLVFLIFIRLYREKNLNAVKSWILNSKAVIFPAAILLLLMPLFYIIPVFVFSDSFEYKPEMDWAMAPGRTYSYMADFISGQSQVSLRYPDLTRNDDKKFGAFISVFGLLSAFLILLGFKRFGNVRLFSLGYIMHFLVSSLIINIPQLANMEYGYRTATPYLLIILVASICAVIVSFKKNGLKLLLVLALFLAFIHMAPLAKKNIENVHREAIISGSSFGQEIAFVKNLPIDGRIITYGLFSSAVDPAFSTLTDRYFSRELLGTNPRSRGIYWRIHGTNAWGQEDFVLNKSGPELYNYLRLGGYKYIFANVCHPVGNFMANGLYPEFVQGIYQNECYVFFLVNSTNYAEKISVLRDIDEEVYKSRDGFRYHSLSTYYDFGDDIPYSLSPLEPEGLDFERINPTEIRIRGSFNDGEWVVFKESYFPRWKAFADDKEVPVMATNFNLVLVKAVKADMIALKYSVLTVEKIFGILSMLAVLSLLVIFLLLLKP
jgi:hypothetical protein